MANILEIIVKATDQASATFQQIGQAGGQSANIIASNWKAIGLAAAAAGVGLEALARSQQRLTADTRNLAADLGMTEKQMRELVTSTADVTMSVGDTVKVMDMAYKQGLTSNEQIKAYAEYWDKVAQVSGESAPALAEAAVSLQAVGIGAENVEDSASALGFILDKTTIGASEFMTMVGRMAPELNAAGLSINDVAAYIGALESKGITGRRAISELRTALEGSGGSTEKMNEALGLTSTELDTFKGAVAGAKDELNEEAAVIEATFTPLQKLQTWASEMAYSMGGTVSVIAGLAPALIAVGPAIKIFDMLSKGAAAAGGVMPLLAGGLGSVAAAGGTALAALIPFLPIIIVLVAAGAALYFAWKTNFMGIRDVVGGAADFIKERWAGVKETFAKVGSEISPHLDKLKSAFGDLFGKVDELFKKFTGGIGIIDLIKKAFELLGRVVDYLLKGFIEFVSRGVIALINGLTWLIDKVSKVVEWFTKLADNPVVRWFIDKLGGAVDWVSKKFDELLPPLEDTGVVLDETGQTAKDMAQDFTEAEKVVSGAVNTMANNTGAATDQMILDMDKVTGVAKALASQAAVAAAQAGLPAGAGYMYNPATGVITPGGGAGAGSCPGGVCSQPQPPINYTPSQWNALSEAEKNAVRNSGQPYNVATGYHGYSKYGPPPVDTGGGGGGAAPAGMSGTWSSGIYGVPPGQTSGVAVQIGNATYTSAPDGSIIKTGETIFSGVEGYTRVQLGGLIRKGGIVIAGETGPEPVILPAGAQVVPNTGTGRGGDGGLIDYQKLADSLAKAIGRPFELHIHAGAFVGDRTAARQLVRFLDDIRIMEDSRKGVIS